MNGKMWNREPLLLVTLAIIISVEGGDLPNIQLGGPIPVIADYHHLDKYMRKPTPYDAVSGSHSAAVPIFKNVQAVSHSSEIQTYSVGNPFDIEIHLCPDTNTLLRKYFNKIVIAGLDKVWLAFKENWENVDIAEHFGMDAFYLYGDYKFALLRINRLHDKQEIAGSVDNIELSAEALESIQGLNYGDASRLFQALRKHASHYITSFATGNSLYQVFVYERSHYAFLSSQVGRSTPLSPVELEVFFSPWLAKHVGNIKSASGQQFIEQLAATELRIPSTQFWMKSGAEIESASQYDSVQAWTTANLRTSVMSFSAASLMELHRNSNALKRLWLQLKNDAVLELQLDTVAPLFKDPTFHDWFHMYITEHLFNLEH